MNTIVQPKAPTEGPVHPAIKDKKYPGFWQAVVLLIIVLGISIFLGVVIGLYQAITVKGTTDFQSSDPFGGISTWWVAIENILTFAVVIWIGKIWAKRPWKELFPITEKTPFFPFYLVALALLGTGSSFLLSEIDNLIRFFLPAPEWIMKMMLELTSNGLASFIVLVIVAPLTEEMFFRGLVLNGFLKRYSPSKAMVLSALLFSIIHLNPYQMIGAFVGGLILAWLRIMSGSLWPSIYLHAVNNGIVFLVISLKLDIPGFSMGDGSHQFQPWWLNGIGLVLLIYGLILSVKLFYKQTSADNGSKLPSQPSD